MDDAPVVRIYDRWWNPVHEIASYDNLSVEMVPCEVGTAALDIEDPTDDDRQHLVAGNNVQVIEDGVVVAVGTLQSLPVEVGDDTSTLKPSWLDLNALLRGEELYADPTQDSGQGATSHDVRGGYVSTVVLGYVDANIGPAALPRRRAAGLQVGQDPRAGAFLTTPAAARFDQGLDFLRPLALANGLVFDFQVESRTPTFVVRPIADRTATVRYWHSLGTIGPGRHGETAPEATEMRVHPPEDSGLLPFRVETDQSRAEAAKWGRRVGWLSSTSMVTDEVAKAAAETEVENLKVWVDSFKDGLKNLTEAYRKLDRVLHDLDLRLGEKYIGPVTEESIAAERTLAITVCDEIGLQLAVFGDESFDIDTEADLSERQRAALVELKRVRDGYQQGGTDTPGHSIINGVGGAIDALHRVRSQFPTDFNLEQQVALDEAKEAFGFVGAKVDVFLSTQPVVAQYRQKALDALAGAVVADRDLTFHTLYAQAEQELFEKGETVELSYEIDSDVYRLGRDVWLGDIVSVWPRGAAQPYEKALVKATLKWSAASGRELTLVVGDYQTFGKTRTDRQLRQVIQTVRRMQPR